MAALEGEIAQFCTEQKRLIEEIAVARVAAQERETALVGKIARLRRAIAGRSLK
jgi:hypothetical protein